jgi:integrase
MASFRKKGRVWYYRFVDADGVQRERKGCGDRRETESLAAAAEAEAAKVRGGYIDPKAISMGRHEARDVKDHLKDFHAYLASRGTAEHAELVLARCTRVIELARFRRLSDLSPSRFQAALKSIRDDGAALRTVHHYVRQFKSFARWLWRDGRVREDNLAHVSPPNPDPDRRHQRRDLSEEELNRLVLAAERGEIVWSITGPDRAHLYRLAALTGLRRKELKSLTPEAFNLDAPPHRDGQGRG